MKILRTIGILAIVSVLVIGGTAGAFAKGPNKGVPQGGEHSPSRLGLFGTVEGVSEEGDVITLMTEDGSTVNMTLTDDTKYKAPRETQGWTEIENFVDAALDGDIGNIESRRLAVLVTDYTEYGTPPPNFTATAVRLMLIKITPPLHAHCVGIVTEFEFTEGEGGSITIIDNKGISHTFEISENSEDTVYRPEGTEDIVVENFVTVVTTGDPKDNIVAKAIVLHDEPPEVEE